MEYYYKRWLEFTFIHLWKLYASRWAANWGTWILDCTVYVYCICIVCHQTSYRQYRDFFLAARGEGVPVEGVQDHNFDLTGKVPVLKRFFIIKKLNVPIPIITQYNERYHRLVVLLLLLYHILFGVYTMSVEVGPGGKRVFLFFRQRSSLFMGHSLQGPWRHNQPRTVAAAVECRIPTHSYNIVCSCVSSGRRACRVCTRCSQVVVKIL